MDPREAKFIAWYTRVVDAMMQVAPRQVGALLVSHAGRSAVMAMAREHWEAAMAAREASLAVQAPADDMTIEEARSWLWDRVSDLAALPPPQNRKDDVGFSGATDSPLRHWLSLGRDQSDAAYLGAADYMRVHAGTQVSREDWQAAFDALQDAVGMTPAQARALLQGGAVVGELRGKVKDGAYEWSGSGPVIIRPGYKKDARYSLKTQPIRDAGFGADEVRWVRTGRWVSGREELVLHVAPHAVARFARFLEQRGRPALAAALLAQAGAWEAQAGPAPTPAPEVARRPARDLLRVEMVAGGHAANPMVRLLFPDRKSSAAVRAVIKLRYDKTGDEWWWKAPVSDVDTIANALRRAGYEVDADLLLEVVGSQIETAPPLANIADAKSLDDIEDPLLRKAALAELRRLSWPRGVGPLPYQEVGIAFALLNQGRTLIADDMGLGKTVQGIGVLKAYADAPSIVVAPSAMVYTWISELRKFAPELSALPIPKTDTPLGPPGPGQVRVMSWDILRRKLDEVKAWAPGTVVADEAHYAKNYKAARAKALNEIGKVAPHLVLLTGTPGENGLHEVYGLLNMLDPVKWRSYGYFVTRYLGAYKGDYGWVLGAPQNMADFKIETGQYMIRRLKSEIGGLPDKSRRFVFQPLEGRAGQVYNRALREFARLAFQRVREELVEAGRQRIARGEDPQNALDGVNRALQMRQRELGSERRSPADRLRQLGQLRQVVGQLKVPLALEWIKDFREANPNEPVLVFVEHHDVAEGIAKGLEAQGIRHALAIGSTSGKRKDELKQAFQSGAIDVLVGSKTIKEGLTLHRANNTLFVERWWVPSQEVQAEDRIHRHGQGRNVTITYLMLEGTVDEFMHELVESKRRELAEGFRDNDVRETQAAGSIADHVFDRVLDTIAGKMDPPKPITMRELTR